MALPTIFWFDKVISFVSRIVPFVATALAFFAWFYNVVAILIVVPINALADGILGLDTAFAQNAGFSALEWMGYVNAVVPLDSWMGVMSALVTFKLSIITFRWTKSFIPAMSN